MLQYGSVISKQVTKARQLDLQKIKLIRSGASSQSKTLESQAIQLLIKSAPRSTSSLQLKVRHLADQTLSSGIFNLPRLSELNLACASLNEAGLESALLSVSGSLKRVVLQGDWIGEKTVATVAMMPALTELVLISKTKIIPTWLQNLPPKAFSALQTLAIDCAEEALPSQEPQWPATLEHLSSRLGSIRSLVLAGDGVVDPQSFITVASRCGSTLRKFACHDTSGPLTNQILIGALGYLRQIEELTFGESKLDDLPHSLTPALGVTLAKKCPKLSKFEFGNPTMASAIKEVFEAVRKEFR
ncbi:hypothetical protein HDU97_009596 [Phlyctochytrium planicorne]|nr:hypothetical protein HDU97_009596 [Phlyctochytrium planicorne]